MNPSSSTFEFSGQVSEWPSSSRAEIFVVLTALYVAPFGCAVHINTDSKATIDGFRRYDHYLTTNQEP